MKRFLSSILLTLLLLCMTFVESQNVSTMGTDFWFSFMRGRIEASMSVTVTGIRDCSGVLTNPNTGWTYNFSVTAGGQTVIPITQGNAYNTASNTVTNKGLHLTTTDTVSVYASNFLPSSFDATFVLPTEALRDEYMVQTFETWRDTLSSEILIVATEDSTIVDIFPTAITIGLSPTTGFNVLLNEG